MRLYRSFRAATPSRPPDWGRPNALRIEKFARCRGSGAERAEVTMGN